MHSPNLPTKVLEGPINGSKVGQQLCISFLKEKLNRRPNAANGQTNEQVRLCEANYSDR